MSTLKRLSKMTAGYGLVQWAGPFVSFIFTPIITRALTPADYGVTDYILTINSALGTIAMLALPQALTAHYNDQPDARWKKQVVGSTLTAALILTSVAGWALFVLAPRIAQSSFGNLAYTGLFQLIGATYAFGACGSVLTIAAQADLRVRWGMALSLTTIVCTVAGNLLFIVALKLGVTGMILTPVVTGMATAIVAVMLAHTLIGKPSMSVVVMLARSGLVLLPTTVAAWMLLLVDRFFLVRYVATTALGYYSIANKIASLLGVALAPLYTAWTPLALAMQHDPAAKERYADVARYLPAARYVGVLTLIHVFGAMGVTLQIQSMADKRLKAISGSIASGAAVNMALNFALIPPFGVWGAAVATAIGYAVPTVLLYWWTHSRLPVPYPMRTFVTALGAELALLGLGQLIPALNFPARVGLKLLVFSLLPLSFMLLGIITPREGRQAWSYARGQLRRVLAHKE